VPADLPVASAREGGQGPVARGQPLFYARATTFRTKGSSAASCCDLWRRYTTT